MGVIKRVVKPVTRKGKKFLQKKEPKLVEDTKQTIFIPGKNASETVVNALKDLYSFKKPDAVLLGKKNDILPFENVVPIEQLCTKYNAPLFMFASHNKKRPNNIVLGRTYNNQLLDMVELGIDAYKAIKDFSSEKVALGIKPCLLFVGEDFTTKPEYSRLKNMLVDMFHRQAVEGIRLQGIEHAVMFTAMQGKVYLRSYRIELKKSGGDSPRVEVVEIGPSLDLSMRRNKLASDDLFKLACKKPKELKAKKVKNVSKDAFGTTHARIHVSKQNIPNIQVKRMKGLRRGPRNKKGASDGATPAAAKQK